jgi:hypothetical protein
VRDVERRNDSSPRHCLFVGDAARSKHYCGNSRQQKRPAAVLRQRPAGRYGLGATRAMRKIGCLAKVVTAWVGLPAFRYWRMASLFDETLRATAQARPRQAARRLLARRATSGFHYTCGPPPFDRDHPAPAPVQPDKVRAFGPAGATLAPGTHYERMLRGSYDLGKKIRKFARPPVCRIGRQTPPITGSKGVACLAESILEVLGTLIIRVCRERSCDRTGGSQSGDKRLVPELLLV